MSNPRIKIDDALGAARSYLHAMRLMTEAVFKGEGNDFCAFDVLIDKMLDAVNDAHEAFDELETPPVDKSNNGEKSR